MVALAVGSTEIRGSSNNMQRYADWSVRNKLVIPVTLAVVVGGLITFLTFVGLSQSIRGITLEHIRDIGELRAVALALTGEYREYVVESNPVVAKEINDDKTQTLSGLGTLFTHNEHHGGFVIDDLESLDVLIKSLLQNGDKVVSTQNEIISGLATLENWEIKAIKAVNLVRAEIEHEAQESRKSKNWEALALATLPRLHSLNDIGLATLQLVSETREYILSSDEETIAELANYHAIYRSSLADFAVTIKNSPKEQLFIMKIDAIEQSLSKVSDGLISLIKQRATLLENIEEASEQLQVTLTVIVASESRKLDKMFDQQKNIVLFTIVIVLLFVVLALVISSQRIKLALEGLVQVTLKISQGDFAARATNKGRDELGVLANSFNNMADSLQKNISQREQVEEALHTALISAKHANQAKSDFLASMSHELRSPLNAILGFGEIINQQHLGPTGVPKYAEYGGDIVTSGRHLLSLINDILDLSAIEAGKRTLTRKKLKIREITNECFQIIKANRNFDGIDFRVEDADDLPTLYADERSVKQIFLNLLSNSAKFTPEGGNVTLRITASNGLHTITVIDTGSGIPADKIATIIDPFVSGDGHPHKAQKGTGLGLTIVKSLVELHGGKLLIESEVGVGTIVTVTIPSGSA